MFIIKRIFLMVMGLLAATNVASAQSDAEDFVSLAGQFAIKLPQKYVEYSPVVNQQLLGQPFNGGRYRWNLGEDSVVIIHTEGPMNLEAQAGSDGILRSARDEHLKRFPNAALLGEKKTSLETHPGLISVFQSDNGRAMIWCYLVKNRLYVLLLTLSDQTKVEGNVNQVSTFRIAKQSDLEPRYGKLIDEMAADSLPQDIGSGKAAPDVEMQHLKGKIKRIVTETEMFFDGEPTGVRYLTTDDQFNEAGFLIRGVSFRAGLPDSVRMYGFLNGDRIYRKKRKPIEYTLVSSDPKNSAKVEEGKGADAQIFKMKYRFDTSGALVESRLVRDDGQEWERFNFSSGKVEHIYYPTSTALNFKKPLDSDKYKDVEMLDAGTNIIETTRTLRDHDKAEYTTIDGKVQVIYHEQYKTENYRYKYEFDDRGNWIRRITTRIDKKKEAISEVPLFSTYRTITYY